MTDEEKKEVFKRLLEEETVKFLRENREVIVKRVIERVSTEQEAKNDGEAQLP